MRMLGDALWTGKGRAKQSALYLRICTLESPSSQRMIRAGILTVRKSAKKRKEQDIDIAMKRMQLQVLQFVSWTIV